MSSAVGKCISGTSSRFTAVLGAQWGDEGKGKLINYLSDNYDVIARFNGGNNSGHVIFKGDIKYSFHLLPSGILNENAQNFIGNGCVVNLEGLKHELDSLTEKGISYKDRVFISDRAHLVFKYHVISDLLIQKRQGIGSTGRGIGPAYATKAHRVGLRVGDLRDWDVFQEKYERLAKIYEEKINYSELQALKEVREKIFGEGLVIDGVSWINQQLKAGKKILAQGSNGALLDVDLGTYPYVAANSTTIGSVATGLGVSPRQFETVIGVMKAYTTRVQQGPFTSELIDSTGHAIREIGEEYGIVTGRERRCGWLDMSLVKYSATLNGYDSLNVTKLDVLDHLEQIKVAVDHKLDGKHIDLPPQTIFEFGRVKTYYETFKGWKKSLANVKRKEDLPQEALDYLKFIEDYTKIPVSWVGVGRENDAFIHML